MEINATESLLTFYPDADNKIEIRCPECASKKKIDASGYEGKYKIRDKYQPIIKRKTALHLYFAQEFFYAFV